MISSIHSLDISRDTPLIFLVQQWRILRRFSRLFPLNQRDGSKKSLWRVQSTVIQEVLVPLFLHP